MTELEKQIHARATELTRQAFRLFNTELLTLFTDVLHVKIGYESMADIIDDLRQDKPTYPASMALACAGGNGERYTENDPVFQYFVTTLTRSILEKHDQLLQAEGAQELVSTF